MGEDRDAASSSPDGSVVMDEGFLRPLVIGPSSIRFQQFMDTVLGFPCCSVAISDDRSSISFRVRGSEITSTASWMAKRSIILEHPHWLAFWINSHQFLHNPFYFLPSGLFVQSFITTKMVVIPDFKAQIMAYFSRVGKTF